jgi:hypothetical protein
VTLKEGYATFCAIAQYKRLTKDIEFCASLVPIWRQETGSLHVTSMSLFSINAAGLSDKHQEMAKTILNQAILPALEGIEVYKTDNFIGKQVSAVKVKPGKLDLSF